MFDKLFVLSQYITPQLGVSNLAGRLADSDSSLRSRTGSSNGLSAATALT